MKMPACKTVMLLILALFLTGLPVFGASWAWNTWREGFEIFEQAERSAIDGRYKDALAQYRKSLVLFQDISQKSPNWNPDVIDGRIKLCQRRIESLKEKVMKEEKERRDTPDDVTEPKLVQEPADVKSAPAAVGGDKALRKELADCRDKLTKAVTQLEEAKQEVAKNKESAEAVTRLVKEKYALETEMESLRRQLAAKAAKPAPSADDNFDLKEQLLKAKIQNDELLRSNRELKQQNTLLEEHKAKLQKICHTSQYEQKQFEEKTSVLEDNLKRLNEKLAAAEKSQRDAEAKLTPLKEEKARLQTAMDKKFQAYEEVSKQLDALRRQGISSGGAAAKQLGQDVVAENEKLRKQLDAANAQSENNAAQLEKIKKTVASLEKERKSLSDTLADQSRSRILNDTDFSKLAEKNRGLLADIERQQGRLSELEQKNQQLNKDLKVLAEKYNADVVQRRSDLRQLAVSDETIRQYEDKLADLRSQLVLATRKVEQLDKSISGQDALLSTRNSELADLRLKLADAEQRVAQIEAARQKEVKEASVKNEELVRQVSVADSKLRLALADQAAVKKELQDLRGKTIPADTAAKLQTELAGIKKQHMDAVKELKLAQTKLENAEKSVLQQGNNYSEAQKKSVQVEKQNSSLKTDLTAANSALEKSRADVAASAKQLADLQRDFEKSQRLTVSLQRELETLKKQNGQLSEQEKSDKSKVEQKLAVLSEEKSRLQQELENSKRKLESAVAENKQVSSQLAVASDKDALVKQLREQLEKTKKQMTDADAKQRAEQAVAVADKDALVKQLREQLETMKKQLASANNVKSAPVENSAPVKTAAPAVAMTKEQNKTVAFLMEAAKNSQKQKDWESALWHYRKVIVLDPENFTAQLQSGEILMIMKQSAEAEKHFRAALRINKLMPDAVLALAESLIARKIMTAEVEELLRQAEVLVPESSRLKLIKARRALLKGDKKDAEKILRSIPAQDPLTGQAALELARLLSADPARRREAMDLYRQAGDAGAEPDNELEKLLIN